MKRLFFLFVFSVIFGFGAFGQSDNTKTHDNAGFLRSANNKKHIFGKKKMDEWYVIPSYNFYYGYLTSWDYMRFRDPLYAAFPYSGHGLTVPIPLGGAYKRLYWDFFTQFQFIHLRPSDPYYREVVQNFSESKRNLWLSVDMSASLGYRIGQSPHYVGFNFLLTSEDYYFTDEINYSTLPTSFRLLHLYHGKIQNVRFRTTTMLPIIIPQNHEKKVKKIFNPTVKIELFPGFFGKNGYGKSTGFFYALDYLNYTYKDYFDYKHRHAIHSFGIVHYFIINFLD